MPKRGTTLAWPALFKMLASVMVLLLLTSPWGRAQGPISPASTTSVDVTFAALHQALVAMANDLLAKNRHSLPLEHSSPDARMGSGLSKADGQGQVMGNLQMRQAIERIQKLLPTVEPILRQEGVPRQFVAIILVESGGWNTALSAKGARGLWQFMPETARRYGLVVTASRDERLDPYKSTHAAGRYLHDLYGQFGNWPLALAAYNAGEDIVQRAVDRTASRDFGFLARAGVLPLETRSYVPAVLKAMEVLQPTNNRFSKRGITIPEINSIAQSSVEIEN